MNGPNNNRENIVTNSVFPKQKIHSSYEKPFLFWALMCLSALITFLVYMPVLNNNFVNWDDPLYIQQNPFIRRLTVSSFRLMFSNSYAGYWVPLNWLSLSFDFHFGKLNPEIYHMHNLILHCLNTVLVYFLSFQIYILAFNKDDHNVKNRQIVCMISALLAALLFGIHPIHVESVAWAAERKDVLYSLFFLSSILVYLEYALRPTVWKYFISLGLFLFSLSAKPMAISLPFVLILLDFWPIGRLQHRLSKVLSEKLPFFIPVLISVSMTLLSHFKNTDSLSNLPLSFRIMNVFHSLTFYLEKLIFPTGLCALYPVMIKNSFSGEYIFSVILIFSIFSVIWILRNKYPALTISWFYYLVTIAPVLGIIQVGTHASADRNTYLPLLGPLLLFAAVFVNFLSKRRLILSLLSVGIVSILAYGTYRQIGTWQDSDLLWENVLLVQPRNASVVYANFADALDETGHLDEALTLFEFALKIDPSITSYHDGKGKVLLEKGLIEESIQEFKTAISLDPNNDLAHCHLAMAYTNKSMYAESLAETQKTIRINPGNDEAYNILGLIYSGQSNYKYSITAFQKALSLEPYNYNPIYLRNLITVCMNSVKVKQSILLHHMGVNNSSMLK